MRILRLTGLILATVLGASVPAATVATALLEDNGTTDPDTYLEWIGGADADPNGLGLLTSGTYVTFQADDGANAGFANIVHTFDPTQTGTARFNIIATEAELQTAASITGNVICNGIAVDRDTDNVFLIVQDAGDNFSVLRIPSLGLGTDTFGPVELVNSVGVFPGIATLNQIDYTTDPNRIVMSFDDDNFNNDGTTNGIHTLPVNATPADSPTLIATFDQLAAGTTPPTSSPTNNMGFRSPTIIQAGANAGNLIAMNTDADSGDEEGDTVLWDGSTSSIFIENTFLDTHGISPIVALDNGELLVWNIASNDADNEHIFWFDGEGNFLRFFATDFQIQTQISNGDTDLNRSQSNYPFASNGVDVAAVFNSDDNETLIEITVAPTTPVIDWSLYR